MFHFHTPSSQVFQLLKKIAGLHSLFEKLKNLLFYPSNKLDIFRI